MNRISRFDTAKTILMGRVVFCHALTFCPGPLAVKEVARFSVLGCAMPLFMFMSGFLSKPRPLKRSTIGLCLLFVLCNTLGNLVLSLSYGIPFDLFRRAPVMWYLLALIVYRLAMPFFSAIPAIPLVAGAFVLSWSFAFLPTSFPPVVGKLFAFLPFFVLGHVIARETPLKRFRNWITSGKTPFKNWFLYAFILVAIWTAGAWFALKGIRPGFLTKNVTFTAFGGGFSTVQWRIVFQLLYVIMGICFLKLCPTHETILSNYGARTLPVYLFHPYILIPVAAFVSIHQELGPWFIRYAAMAFAALVSLAFFHPWFLAAISRLLNCQRRKQSQLACIPSNDPYPGISSTGDEKP